MIDALWSMVESIIIFFVVTMTAISMLIREIVLLTATAIYEIVSRLSKFLIRHTRRRIQKASEKKQNKKVNQQLVTTCEEVKEYTKK